MVGQAGGTVSLPAGTSATITMIANPSGAEIPDSFMFLPPPGNPSIKAYYSKPVLTLDATTATAGDIADYTPSFGLQDVPAGSNITVRVVVT